MNNIPNHMKEEINKYLDIRSYEGKWYQKNY